MKSNDPRITADFHFHDIGGRYYAIGAKYDGSATFYDADEGEHYDIDFARLAAWAKAGCPDWGSGKDTKDWQQWNDATNYIAIGKKYDCHRNIGGHIDDLTAERDRLQARVAELEKGAKGKPPKEWRCIDCEHLKLDTVKKGHGYCGAGAVGSLNIYMLWRCSRGFTPAAEGCGSTDQALRTELARKTK